MRWHSPVDVWCPKWRTKIERLLISVSCLSSKVWNRSWTFIPWLKKPFVSLWALFMIQCTNFDLIVFQEWLWPVGYYLRARLHYALKLDKNLAEKVLSECKSYLANHFTHLKKSDWRGLPELTNKDAAYCSFSCPTQAWSMSSILEVTFWNILSKLNVHYLLDIDTFWNGVRSQN